MAPVERDGSELLASLVRQREKAARAQQIAMVLTETAAQLRIDAAEVRETAAKLCAQPFELRAQGDTEGDAAGKKRRIGRSPPT